MSWWDETGGEEYGFVCVCLSGREFGRSHEEVVARKREGRRRFGIYALRRKEGRLESGRRAGGFERRGGMVGSAGSMCPSFS